MYRLNMYQVIGLGEVYHSRNDGHNISHIL